jgi:predicted AAA+ superfamily ATPase
MTTRRGSIANFKKKTQTFSTMKSVWCGAGEGEGEGLFFYDTKAGRHKIKAHEASRSSSSGEVEERE